jgi:predicted DNA-binding antitoxin AbrB/MazE fold protein
MTSKVVPGVYENGIIKLSEKLDISGKKDVLIIFEEEKTDLSAVKATLEILNRLLSEVRKNFEDRVYRQIFFFNFKETLSKLWELSCMEKNFREGISLLEDAVLHLKSEHMEMHQIDALEEALNILSKIDMTDDDLRMCDRILFEAEMYTIPPMGKIWE